MTVDTGTRRLWKDKGSNCRMAVSEASLNRLEQQRRRLDELRGFL